MDAAAVEEGTPPLAALTPLALEGTEEEPWEPPTSFPHVTNWKPAAAMQRKRRGSVLRTMSKTVDVRVALLGLSGVGKTTLAEQLAHADPVTITVTPVTPVDGHLVTHNPNSNLMMMIWDMNGEAKARRAHWPDQCVMAAAIMFCFDVSNPSSLELARDELFKVLSHPDLNPHAPLLIWANKMDVVGAITESALAEMLALDQRPDCAKRQWCVQGSVLHDRGRGMDHGLKWLYLALSQKVDKKAPLAPAPIAVPNENQSEIVTPVSYEEAHPPKNTPRPAASTPPKPTVSPSAKHRMMAMETAVEEEEEEEEEEESEEEEAEEEEEEGQQPEAEAEPEPEPEPEGATQTPPASPRAVASVESEADPELDSALEAELQQMDGKQLKQRALADGVSAAAVEDARDQERPWPVLIGLIIAQAGVLRAQEKQAKAKALQPVVGVSGKTTFGTKGAWLAPYATNYEPIDSGKGAKKKAKAREFRVVLCGLSGCGKTTVVMQAVKQCEITWEPALTPLEGEMTMHKHKTATLILWDLAGSEEGRGEWLQHLEDQAFSALVYVVDSTKQEEVLAGKAELARLLSAPTLPDDVPVLVLANKQDAEGAKMDAFGKPKRLLSASGALFLGAALPALLPACARVLTATRLAGRRDWGRAGHGAAGPSLACAGVQCEDRHGR